jgi:glycosyltransferase involved in cell wall biosynthesis
LRPKLPYTPSLGEIALCVHWLRSTLTPLLFIPAKTEVVHTTVNGLGALPAWIASHIHNVPLLLTEHHIALRERYLESSQKRERLALKRFQAGFYEALSRLLYWQADRILSVSEFNRTWQLRFAAPRERTQIIHNGVDISHVPNLSGQKQAVPTLVWLGRIHPLKDLETLLNAFWQVRQLVPAQLRLFGPVSDAGYIAKLQTLVKQLGLESSVQFAGPLRASHEAFAQGDVVVSSSKSEGFPLTLLEAMACGKAVVATRVGGMNELLGNAGRLVPAQSPTALASALLDMLLNKEARFKLEQKARERAKAFPLEKTIAAYNQLYEDITQPLRPRETPAFLIIDRPTHNDIVLVQDEAA